MTGDEVRVEWHGRRVLAWRPEPLAVRDLEVTSATVRTTERARQSLIAADLATPASWEVLARLLLRAEGVSSSFIEGVHADPAEVAYAVAAHQGGGAAAWVAANLEVIDLALAHAHGGARLDLATLCEWHAALMAGHSRLPDRLVGALRDEVGWIGGTSPLDAALVVAPPDDVPALVEDLLAFADAGTDDPVLDAAVVHGQFEVIHPFGDGNGRLGRVLVLWLLARRLGLRVLPPLSARIAVDPGGYLSGLTTWRLIGADTWAVWFADTLTDSAGVVRMVTERVAELQVTWAARLDASGTRADAAARALLTLLPSMPLLSSTAVAEALGVSERSGRTALLTLAEVQIVTPFRPSTGSRHRWWSVPEVLALMGAR